VKFLSCTVSAMGTGGCAGSSPTVDVRPSIGAVPGLSDSLTVLARRCRAHVDSRV
jgi:hypothetical protein